MRGQILHSVGILAVYYPGDLPHHEVEIRSSVRCERPMQPRAVCRTEETPTNQRPRRPHRKHLERGASACRVVTEHEHDVTYAALARSRALFVATDVTDHSLDGHVVYRRIRARQASQASQALQPSVGLDCSECVRSAARESLKSC